MLPQIATRSIPSRLIPIYFSLIILTMMTASVAQWSEFLATDAEVSGSITGATRFFLVVVGLERGLLSLVSLVRSTEELLE